MTYYKLSTFSKALSSMSGSLVIDLSAMNNLLGVAEVPLGSGNYIGTIEVIMCKDHNRIYIDNQAGMRNGKLYSELYNAGGFHFPSGTSPGVGVGGLTTGGGRGMTVRKFGFAMDNVVSFTAVIANGSVVVASSTSYSDLFWAMLGGGGGSFGIVTTFNVKVYKTPVNSLAFLRYSLGADYFNIFQSTLANLPPEYSTSCRLESTNSYIIINYLGPMEDLQALIINSGLTNSLHYQWMTTASCDALGARSFSCCGDFTCQNAQAILSVAYAPVETVTKDYEKSKSDIFYSIIPLAIVDQVVNMLTHGPRPDVYFDCYMSDGPVINSRKPTDTPYPNRNNGIIFMCEYSVPSSDNGADYYPGSPNYIWLHQFEALLKPYASGYKYYNYADLELTNFGQAYWGDVNFKRLIEIKAKYDPNNWFRSVQSIPLTYNNTNSTLIASVPVTTYFTYVGCFVDKLSSRSLPYGGLTVNSIAVCAAYAQANSYIYFGAQWYNGPGIGLFECWCGNNYTSAIQFGVSPPSNCPIGTDNINHYGGGGANAIYNIVPHATTAVPVAAPTVIPSRRPSSRPTTKVPIVPASKRPSTVPTTKSSVVTSTPTKRPSSVPTTEVSVVTVTPTKSPNTVVTISAPVVPGNPIKSPSTATIETTLKPVGTAGPTKKTRVPTKNPTNSPSTSMETVNPVAAAALSNSAPMFRATNNHINFLLLILIFYIN